jgi:hypothetical protein
MWYFCAVAAGAIFLTIRVSAKLSLLKILKLTKSNSMQRHLRIFSTSRQLIHNQSPVIQVTCLSR